MASTPAAVTDDDSTAESVAFVSEKEGTSLEIHGPIIEIDSIEGRSCNVMALLDTGSPVSFIKYRAYLTYVKPWANNLMSTQRKFVNIKNLPLDIMGEVKVELTLKLLKDKLLSVNLFVIKDQAFAADIILDREFITLQKLTIIYKLHDVLVDKSIGAVALFE